MAAMIQPLAVAATLPGLTQALGRTTHSMNSTLRFFFILFVLWLGITVVQVVSASWLDDQIYRCMIAFNLERQEQDAFDFFLCHSFDLIRQWGWLLAMISAVAAALALTFTFRRTAA